MELFLLYLWTRLDALNLLLLLSTLVVGLAALIMNSMHHFATEYDAQERAFQQASKYHNKALFLFIVSCVFTTMVPSKEDAAILAGGWLTKEIITAPQTQEVGSKLYKLINQKLDEQLAQQEDTP